MKGLCYLDYSDCCPHLYCYIYNVSADVPSSLLQVLLVKLGNLLGSFHVVIACCEYNKDQDNSLYNLNNIIKPHLKNSEKKT